MPSIDVQVVRGGRPIGVARSRPLRVTPHGCAGVVYKGRVHEVHVNVEIGYFIDAVSESWGGALTVCPIAPHREALGLLKRLRTSNPGTNGVCTAPAVEGLMGGRGCTEGTEGGSDGDGSASTSSIEQILDLLMPHSRSSKAG